MKPPKRNQTADEIAGIFDVHVKTVRTYPRDGCPHRKQGRAYFFNDEEVNKWLRDTGRKTTPGRPAQAKSEAEIEQQNDKDYWLARKYRIQCLREEGKMVDAEQVKNLMASIATVTRNRMQMIAAQVAAQLEGRSAMEIQGILEQRINESLSALSANGTDEADESLVLSEPGAA